MAFLKLISRARPVCSALLAWLLTLQCLQTPGSAQASTIEIVVQGGEGYQVVSDYPRNDEFIVGVQDRNGNRVRNATVFFEIPPGYGTFAGGLSAVTAMTDENGVARARLYHRGTQSGPFEVTVTASYMGMRATARIHQTNVTRSVLSVPHRALLIGGVLAVAGAVAYGVTKNDRRTSVSLGAGTVTPRP